MGKLRPFVVRIHGDRAGEFLVAPWQACIDFDVTDRLPACKVPIHIIGFSQDLQAPPRFGEKGAQLAGNGHFHLLEALGHLYLAGHRPEVVNECIDRIIVDYAAADDAGSVDNRTR